MVLVGKDRREFGRRQWGYLITHMHERNSQSNKRKQKLTKADKDVEKKKPLFIAGRQVK